MKARLVCILMAVAMSSQAGSTGLASSAAGGTNSIYPIDLEAALRLAGARNLDIQIARERLNEAEANRQSANERFIPWLAPGVSFHRRDGVAQAVPAGTISDAHFQSYSPGITLGAQVTLGEAIYNSLAAKQLVKASNQGLETQRQDASANAAQGYFELAEASALVEVARQSLQISRDYLDELHTAVGAGIAFKGDELRVQSQSEHNEIVLQKSLEHQRVAAASLAQLLHLDPRVELVPEEAELVPIALFDTNSALDSLVVQALIARPESKQSQAFIAAAQAGKDGAVYGPLIPSVGAQAFGGGLGGGPDGGHSTFAGEADYLVGVSWKIGPGGLFDFGQIRANKARVAAARVGDSALKDAIVSQVVTNFAHVQSLAA